MKNHGFFIIFHKRILYLSTKNTIITALFTLLLLLFPLLGPTGKYTIRGSFSKPQTEEWIYLVRFMEADPKVDSARIIDGKFMFEGEVDIPEMYALSYHHSRAKGLLPVFLEPATLTVVIDPADWENGSTISGGKVNDEYRAFLRDIEEKYTKKIIALYDQDPADTEDEKKELENQMKKLVDESMAFRLNYIKTHYDSPVSVFLLAQIYPNLSPGEVTTILSGFSPELKNTVIYKTISSMLEHAKSQHAKEVAALDFDNDFTELTIDFSGRSILQTLNEQNPGRALYIDIWAPWCGPCIKEFPHSRALREKYGSGKIAFVYICADVRTEITPSEWKAVIEKQQLKGRHYMMGPDLLSRLGRECGTEINGIPHYILIDKNGTVISANAPRPGSKKIEDMIDGLR